jgi:hypothetical protein
MTGTSRVPRHEFLNRLITSKGSLDYKSALKDLQSRMSDFAGITRDKDLVLKAAGEAWALWERMNRDLQAVPPAELPQALRVFDLCLTHAVYLESIAEFLDQSKNQEFVRENILEVELNGDLQPVKTWVPVRPVPARELWFENIWKQYREGSGKGTL